MKNNIIGFRRVRSVKSADAKSARKCKTNLCEAFKKGGVFDAFKKKKKEKKSLDKQFGNCAVSLKVPESAVLWLG